MLITLTFPLAKTTVTELPPVSSVPLGTIANVGGIELRSDQGNFWLLTFK